MWLLNEGESLEKVGGWRAEMFSVLTQVVDTLKFIHFMQEYLNGTYVATQLFSKIPGEEERES